MNMKNFAVQKGRALSKARADWSSELYTTLFTIHIYEERVNEGTCNVLLKTERLAEDLV